MKGLLLPLSALLLLGSVLCAAETSPAYDEAALLQWRRERTERLQAPEGWLSLVGLHWLKAGTHRIGSAPDCEIRIEKAPALLLTLTLEAPADRLEGRFAPDTGALLDRAPAPSTPVSLASDATDKPSRIRAGSLSLSLIRRGDRLGIRVKDTDSPARLHFAGLDYFPVDPSWRIVARWLPFAEPRTLKITNVLGQVSEEKAPGKAVFERDGKTWELIPTQDAPGEELFFVLRDATSGKETYGASRFLVAEAPKDGRVVLDFNRAYNPPCAFTEFATCPLPIPENRLSLAIRAGEKTYAGEH